jgi:hypothetical protein
MIQRVSAVTEQGQSAEGITQLQQGVTASQTTGAELIRRYCLALLARV